MIESGEERAYGLARGPREGSGGAGVRYRLRFAAERLWAAWKRWQGARRVRPGRLAAGIVRVAAASALLLLLSAPQAARALVVRRFSRYPFGLGTVGSRASPAFADLDGDGDLDAFIGEWYGQTLVFQNSGTASAPAFAAAVGNPFGLGNVGYLSSPVFADLDSDGDLDALIGEWYSNTQYFENSGTASAPAFAAAVGNPFGLTAVGSSASPEFADPDGDGDLDAFIGDYMGNTQYFENSGTASAPAFAAAISNPFGLADVGYLAAPTFADLDGDGDLDAFIGERYGNTQYFENSGTASAPAFAAAISSPFGLGDVGYFASPEFADLDGDGDLDALIGEHSGTTRYFENSGTASAPAFAAAVSNPFGLTDVGTGANPSFADLDGDGDLDAFIGQWNGNTQYFENTGTASAPAFAAAVGNPFGLGSVGYLSSPEFADLDGDGDLDAFIGEYYGNTQYFENSGTASAPAFAAAVSNPFGLVGVGYLAAPTFADLDGDGDLDAFIGERYGNTLVFENSGSASAPAFAPATSNPFGLADVGHWANPAFADLDADGDVDAFIGAHGGDTLVFENTGSATAPAFAAALTNPFGLADVGGYASPTFADLDGDGDLDAFIGEWYGTTQYFENVSVMPRVWLPLGLCN